MTNERKLTLTREREKKAEQGIDTLAAAITNQRRAYIEAATMALLQNPQAYKENTAGDLVAYAVAVAESLVEEIYLKPMEKAKEETNGK